MNYRPLKFFAIAASSLAATLAICFGIMAWSEPGATPPGGNVAAPINTGSILQNKIGDLLIGAGLKISSLGTAFALKTNDAQETPHVVVGQDGNVGIGTTAPGKKLEVAGDTKSTQFCLGDQCCSSWSECAEFAGIPESSGCQWDASPKRFSGITSVSSSADGTKLAVSTYTSTYQSMTTDAGIVIDGYDISGYIFTSSDSGATWVSHKPYKTFDNIGYTTVAISPDGTHLSAAGSDGYRFDSSDSGATWTVGAKVNRWIAMGYTPGNYFYGIADNNGLNQTVYCKNNHDFGGMLGIANLKSIASSDNGKNLIVGGYSSYISSDYGITWTSPTTAAYWVASSSDGAKLVAAINSGYLSTSSDSGVSWVKRKFGHWVSVASSSDGAKLVAADNGSTGSGYIYTSSDSGAAWVKNSPFGHWVSAASSSDGAKLIAAIDEYVYIGKCSY